MVYLDFKASNNKTEYEALPEGLRLVSTLQGRHLQIFSDSQLVVYQVKGEFAQVDKRRISYYNLALKLLKKLEDVRT